jgi:hypothetical protein
LARQRGLAEPVGPRGRPISDLWLSPDHAVFVEDVLIPVQRLVNGSTIVQVRVEWVAYHHVELEQHDVLLAEGLPAERFLDMWDGTNDAHRPGPVRLRIWTLLQPPQWVVRRHSNWPTTAGWSQPRLTGH